MTQPRPWSFRQLQPDTNSASGYVIARVNEEESVIEVFGDLHFTTNDQAIEHAIDNVPAESQYTVFALVPVFRSE